MRHKKYESELQSVLANKLSLLRNRCKNGRGKAINKGPATPFDLTNEWLFEQYEIQKGKCFFTNIKMELNSVGGAMLDSLSFDRFDSKKGYLMGNVVLSIHGINVLRSWGLPKNRPDIENKIRDLIKSLPKVPKQQAKFKKQVLKGKKIITP